ncbi:MAG: enoyl-CoA hydratase-related protein [Proteobacteria bacterium]|nr:enoyl-CoA hydratase-related protein [Pseudomonadota bacterium]
MPEPVVLIDDPAPHVRRITLNRPEKRNALNHALRGALVEALREADQDPDVRVMIVRGAGKCFSAGYDLGGGNEGQEYPWYTAGGDGQWPRHVTQGWMGIWELSKVVIAQVHGHCLAGGSELATCCDLVYMADDAQMGYPAVRFGVPDNHFHAWFVGMRKAMEMMVTGDSLSGVECAQLGWANDSVPADELEAKVLEVAKRVTQVPPDMVQLNKRAVHRQMEIMGLHTGIRAGSELCALGTHQKSMHEFLKKIGDTGLKNALQERDEPFGDYRTDANAKR